MNDLPFWVVLIATWLAAFAAMMLAVSRLNPFLSACVISPAGTIGVVATLAYIRSWTPDRPEDNLDLLIVFIALGMMLFLTSICVMALRFGGAAL